MEKHFGYAPDTINAENGAEKSSSQNHFKMRFPRSPEKKIAMRKEMRKKKQERKNRIIIRNLSFQVNEEDLRKVFSAYGEVVDVSIPKKPDGKMRGFAFIQYERFQSAIEAIRNLNYKTLKGRPVAIDYAVAKDKYQHITSSKYTTNSTTKEKDGEIQIKEEREIKEEEDVEDIEEDSDAENKSADSSVSEEGDVHVKEFMKEFDAGREPLQDVKDEKEDRQSSSESSSDSEDDSEDLKKLEDDSDSDNDMEDEDTETHDLKRKSTSEIGNKEQVHKKRNLSRDVNEGKTIFIRNVSFDSTEEDLKNTMEEAFGPVTYCLLCIDKFTELPKGTAFVKFENKEDAYKAIEKSDSDGIYLDGRKIYCSLALSQEEIQSRTESGTKTGKDKRNLYLLRVGLIKNGSEEAEGVSQSDIAKRNQLEILKKNKLKNLQFFVSDKRLCVHNIPSYYTDTKLRKLFKSVVGPAAKITEARIMRNLKKLNPQGTAESKGFGFVSFEKHEDALKALKEINNNPKIFTSQKRPIVEFAIENMNALLTKERRKEKSRMKIKKISENSATNHPEEENLATMKFNKRKDNKQIGKPDTARMMYNNSYSGKKGQFNKSVSKKNKTGNMSNTQRKPKFKGEEHVNNSISSSKERSPKKKKKNKQQKKKSRASEGADSGNFSQMVNKYKQKLLSKMD